jgi:hypothetical protein
MLEEAHVGRCGAGLKNICNLPVIFQWVFEMVTNYVSFLVPVVLPLAAFLFPLSTCQFALLALWPIRYSTAALGLIRIYFALSSIHIPCFQLVDVFLFPLSSGG